MNSIHQHNNDFSFVLFFDSTQRKKEGLNLSTQNCQGQGYVGRVVDIFSNWFCQNPLLHCIAICCFEREDPQIVPKFSLSRFVHFKRGPEDILEEMLYASWFMFLILHMRRVPTSLEVDLRSTTKVGRFSYNLSIFFLFPLPSQTFLNLCLLQGHSKVSWAPIPFASWRHFGFQRNVHNDEFESHFLGLMCLKKI